MISDLRSMSRRAHEAPDAVELLIKEARRAKRLRRWRNIAIVFVALVVVTVISVIQTTDKTPSKPKPKTGVAKFVDLMKHANGTQFVVTYHVHHYDWMGSGVITMAQIPIPPGTKATTNSDGYTGGGKIRLRLSQCRQSYLAVDQSGNQREWV